MFNPLVLTSSILVINDRKHTSGSSNVYLALPAIYIIQSVSTCASRKKKSLCGWTKNGLHIV